MQESVRRVHMPDEHQEYGIKFVRSPLEEEKESVRYELRKAAKKTGRRHVYNADSPGLTAALNSDEADEWTKAINDEYKNLGLETLGRLCSFYRRGNHGSLPTWF